MKQKKAGYVLIAVLLLCNLHFLHGLAEGTEARRFQLISEPVPVAWVMGAPVRFHAGPDYQQAYFSKVSEALADDKEIPGEEGSGKSGMRSPGQLIEQIPYVRSVVALKDKVMNKVAPVLENPDGRIFMPMFSSDNKNRMPRQEFSGSENFAGPDSDKRESGRSAPGQERYLVGYRLSPGAVRQSESWYFGFGWKSGGGRGRRETAGKEGSGFEIQRNNALSDAKDQGQNAVKVEYSGPIVGLIGQF